MNSRLSNRELRRYNRQIMIPEIGMEGQLKLKEANVLVIGAGALGCPVLQYLSAAGIGKISIADYDLVEETDISRKTLYGSDDLGKLKSIIAKSRLEKINPLCEYTILNRRVDNSCHLGFFRNYNVIVDATDNPETRDTISNACLFYQKPLVLGSILKFKGVVSVFNYRDDATSRDINIPALAEEFMDPAPYNVGFFGV